MAATFKRKRAVQDENIDLMDNFQILRQMGENKKRRLDCEERKTEIKNWFNQVSHASPFKRLKTPTPSRRRLSLSSSKNVQKTSSPISDGPPPPLAFGEMVETRSSFRRRNSLQRLKKPLLSIQGTVRAKIVEQAKRKSMRGRQDYALPMTASGQLDYVRFLSAQEERSGRFLSVRDQYLQQKIDHEIKMRDGTAKLLAASKHPQQMLEAAKNLLTSNSRMISYMTELQKRKTDQVMNKQKSTEGDQVPCSAKICVSDVRVPLMWKDVDHFKNKGDHRRYAVFCLVKIGTEVQDTSLITEVDRTMTDLVFHDNLFFHDISNDFECHLEVYAHKLYDDLSIASTPSKIKKKINDLSSSVGRSLGKRLSGLRDEPEFMPNMLLGPKFDCIAHGDLTLRNVGDCVSSHDLVMHNTNDTNSCDLPLFGSYCCRLVAQPQCMVHDTTTGPLMVQLKSGWQSCWCRLRNLELTCWANEDEVDCSEPLLVVPVTKDTQVSDIPPSRVEREFSFSVSSKKGIISTETVLAADNQGELTRWWDGLQQHFLDQVMWQQACDSKLALPDSPTDPAPAFLRAHFEPNDADSPMTKVLNRLNIPEDAKAKRNKRRSAPPLAFQTNLAVVASDDAPCLTPSRSHEDLKEPLGSLETDI